MAVQTPESVDAAIQETFGVTEAITLSCATPKDEAETLDMLNYLDRVAPVESEEGLRERWEALVDLEEKVSEWLITSCNVSVPSGYADYAVCRVLTFGSFRLGIIRPSSDIDTLILIPSSVSRDRFFSEFISDVLPRDPGVTECLPVTDARVPIAKVKFRGIFLDILVASVPPASILAGMESVDDALIFKVDEKCMKSMNGIRVADKILQLVPDPATFRQAARMIKFWAQQRCIYSNSVGYFGGVSWSMAVARVCQLYPNFSAKQIVERFFYTFSSWSWEEHGPVVLCHPQEVKIPPSLIRSGGVAVLSQFKDWNPQKYSSDRFQVMPVITPIFPSHNTTYNVTESQKLVMMDEIRRGKDIVQLMHLGQGSVGFSDLCLPLNFWSLFSNFLELEISATNDDIFSKFKGLVESRMRALIRCIEQADRRILPRPHPDFFVKSATSGSFFIGLKISSSDDASIDLKSAVSQFISDTMEKGLQAPEWSGIPLTSIRLEIKTSQDPFPAQSASTSVKRQRVDHDDSSAPE